MILQLPVISWTKGCHCYQSIWTGTKAIQYDIWFVLHQKKNNLLEGKLKWIVSFDSFLNSCWVPRDLLTTTKVPTPPPQFFFVLLLIFLKTQVPRARTVHHEEIKATEHFKQSIKWSEIWCNLMYLPEGKIWYIKPQMSFETGMNFEKKPH